MKAIDFTVSEHNSVSIVFIFINFIKDTAKALIGIIDTLLASLLHLRTDSLPMTYLFCRCEDNSYGQNHFCTQGERSI